MKKRERRERERKRERERERRRKKRERKEKERERDRENERTGEREDERDLNKKLRTLLNFQPLVGLLPNSHVFSVSFYFKKLEFLPNFTEAYP